VRFLFNGGWDLKLSKAIQRIEKRFPPNWAETGDFAGFLVGDPWADVERVLLALDPLITVVNEAAEKGVDLLITHHPPDIEAPERIVKGDTKTGAYFAAVKGDVAMYVIHTAWDVSTVSPSFALAAQLGLLAPEVVAPTDKGSLFKLVVFIPEEHLEKVRKAITDAGAGHIGNYSECTFSTSGEGTFKPGAGTSPYSGKVGERKLKKESRLETIVPEERLSAVIEAMTTAHPYEEIAYDIYAVENVPGRIGFGAVGELPKPLSLLEMAHTLKGILPAADLSVCGNSDIRVSRVAVIGGSGGKFIDKALSKNADVLITGEAGYHQQRYAEARGLPLIIAGHFATEWVGLPLLKDELEKVLWDKPGEGIVEIASSEHNPMWIT